MFGFATGLQVGQAAQLIHVKVSLRKSPFMPVALAVSTWQDGKRLCFRRCRDGGWHGHSSVISLAGEDMDRSSIRIVPQFCAWATLCLLCLYSVAQFRLWREAVRRERADALVTLAPDAQTRRAVGHVPSQMLAPQRDELKVHRPSPTEWHDLEHRFGRINGELRAHWIRYEHTGEVV